MASRLPKGNVEDQIEMTDPRTTQKMATMESASLVHVVLRASLFMEIGSALPFPSADAGGFNSKAVTLSFLVIFNDVLFILLQKSEHLEDHLVGVFTGQEKDIHIGALRPL